MVRIVQADWCCHPHHSVLTVRVKGLDDFRRELRRADKRMGKAFGKANKKIGEKVVAKGRPSVVGLPSPGGSVSVAGIKASAKQSKAVIRLTNRKALFANVFGTRSHMVFGRPVPGSGPFRPWLGQSWKPEELYGIGPAIKTVADDFALDEYLGAVLDALGPAFPD